MPTWACRRPASLNLIFFLFLVLLLPIANRTTAQERPTPEAPSAIPFWSAPDRSWELNRGDAFGTVPPRASWKTGSDPRTLNATVHRPVDAARPNNNPFPFLNFDVTGTPFPAGDVNGDGHADYVYTAASAADERTTNPADTTGKTALYFGADEPVREPDQTLYAHLRPVGDLNDDGHNDAVGLGAQGSIRIYTGQSSGYRKTDAVWSRGPVGQVHGFADFDGDGYDDVLLAAAQSGHFTVLFGAENIKDAEMREYDAGTTASSYTYNAADLNGNGHGSVVRLVGEAPRIEVQHFVFDSETRALERDQEFVSAALKGSAAENDLSLVDINGSGRREIVTTAGNGTPVYVFPVVIGIGGTPVGYATSPDRLVDRVVVPVGDLNGDGRHDFYAFRQLGTTHHIVFGADGTSDLGGDTEIPFAPTTFGGASFRTPGRLGDLNGDGFDDAILRRARFGEQPYEVGRRFVYGKENQLVTTDTVSMSRRDVYDRVLGTRNVGDLNVDGSPDVAATFFDRGKVGIYFGGASFRGAPDKLLSVGPFPYSVARLDFNGDGVSDLAVATWGVGRETSELKIFFGGSGFGGAVGGQADRSVTFHNTAPPGFTHGFYQVANAGDVNGDGSDDVLVSAPFSVHKESGKALNEVYLFFGDQVTLGAPSAVVNYSDSLGRGFVGAGYRMRGIGDFNNDGLDDFAIGLRGRQNENGSNGAVHVFYGDETFDAGTADLAITPGDAQVRGFSFGLAGGPDVSGDGVSDLLISPVHFPQGTAAQAYYGGTGEGLGDAVPDARYEIPTAAMGGRAGAWDPDGDGLVNRNYGSITLADFNGDDTTEVVLNTGFAGSSRLTNAVLYEGGDANEPDGPTYRPDAVLRAPNPRSTLGGAYSAAAGRFGRDEGMYYVSVQNRDGNEAYWSSRLYRYRPYETTLPAPSRVTARRDGERVTISWQGPRDDRLAGYRLYGGSTEQATTVLDSVGRGATRATHVAAGDTLQYFRVAAVDVGGRRGRMSTPVRPTSVVDGLEVSTWPNPTRRSIQVEYALPQASRVDVAVYDVLGRRVLQIEAGRRPPGVHRARVHHSLPTGTYFLRLSAGEKHRTEKVTVVR